MVLGKNLRLYAGRESGKVSFLLENRQEPQCKLLFQNGAVITVTPSDEAEAIKSQLKHQLDGYACLGVFKTITSDGSYLHFLVLVTGCISVGKIFDTEIFRITDTGFVSLRGLPQDGERIVEVRRILNSGTFYFSWSQSHQPLDITLCAQRAIRTNETDNRFFWNRTLFDFFTQYRIDTSIWLTKAMCGSISISTVYAGSKQAKACLFSRLSCERAGTRFNVRGVNDDGHVANFVETEQVIFIDPNTLTSYVLIRGSVPLFWEQPGYNVGSHKIKMSRGSEVTQPAYDRHVALLKNRYGGQHFINLCGSKEGEANLTRLYQAHHKTCRIAKDIPLTSFDYHHHCARGRTDNLKNILREQIAKHLQSFGFFTMSGSRVTSKQNGTFRVNCIDCLDRTNCVQTYLGLEVLDLQLKSLDLIDKIPHVLSKFQDTFKNMWVLNGDQVSRIYAGTGALEGKSKLKDSTLSVARTIQNNLLDSSKQKAFDILLSGCNSSSECYDRAKALLPGPMLQLPNKVLDEMCDRHLEYTEPMKIKLCVATWNVNGGTHFNSLVYKKSDPLSDWLLDHHKDRCVPNIMDLSLDAIIEESCKHIDIFAIGFQEIVDLNASNIVAASTSNQREWMIELQKTISRDTPYVLVTSVQLVGVCLFLFVRPEHATKLRDVAIDQVKTGLGGATGNKGGVSIRFRLYSSTIAFVCAHFAAGQHQISDRNADYGEISKKLCPFNQPLVCHDYVFWCGDFNYRIDLENDVCKDLAAKRDFKTLLQSDQLTVQKAEGKVFEGYVEGEINFPPTYKYDNNSDDYDTSEKCRVPAYTDRVLFKKNSRKSELSVDEYGKLVYYGRAELKSSDHRPVSAVIEIDCNTVVDENKRNAVLKEVLDKVGPPDATIILEGAQNVANDQLEPFLQSLERDFGNILIAKQSEGMFKVIFRHGSSALKAAALKQVTLDGYQVRIEIKSPDWSEDVQDQINNIDNTIPLTDGIAVDPLELEANTSLGPQVDPSLLFAEDDDNESSHSGRSTPGINEFYSNDGHNKVPPSRPPPPSKAPERPPLPPASIIINQPKQTPSRPAPPPPTPLAKNQKQSLQKQAALNPPTITKTAPSTDSEVSFDIATSNTDSATATQQQTTTSSEPPKANPFALVQNEWEEANNKAFDDSVFADAFGDLDTSHKQVTTIPSTASQEGSDEEDETSTLPPSFACPPPPIPSSKPPCAFDSVDVKLPPLPPPPAPSRPAPPVIPSRSRVPPIPPRKQ